MIILKAPPMSPGLSRQPSVGNVLARTSSFGSPLLPRQSTAPCSSPESSAQNSPKQTAMGSPGRQASAPVQHQNSGGGTGNGVLRQGSQGSIFEQIASQAKGLVRETTRQSSQEGLLAHMDKVIRFFRGNSFVLTMVTIFVENGLG